jgi:putative membrane protein insertion efficiency factor
LGTTGSERFAARFIRGVWNATLVLALALGLATIARADERDSTRTHDPATAAIRFYQRYLSPLRHGRCHFSPSCSQYALEAIRKYGVIEGTARAADRLVRCDQASGRYYVRAADGRLLDPVSRAARDPISPRVPAWLLNPPASIPPPTSDVSSADSSRVAEILSYAASLEREGDCFRAGTEYRRAAHLAASSAFEGWARERIGGCSFEASEWLAAEPEYLSAAMLAPRGLDRRRATMRAAACRFDAGDFAGCESILTQCADAELSSDLKPATLSPPTDTADPADRDAAEQRQRSAMLLGLCSLARGRWSSADDRFHEALDQDPTSPDARRLARLSARAGAGENLSHRSRRLATALSIGIPGAGQVYAGRASEGLRHFIWNGALLYSIVRLVRTEHYPAAILLAGFETPFYMGNVIGAGNAATSFDRARRLEFVQQVVDESER